ncbi:MAG TPA: 4-hydroxy-tetrahydrodipicolinate reductase [Gaiellaceae bacterium]
MIRVCVAGITGWTGRPVAEAVAAADDLELVAGVARSSVGEGMTTHASVAEALDAFPADVLVDYTSAEAVKANVVAALERRVAVVVGSSGLTADDFVELDERAREAGVGVVAAGNFSLLAALLLRFAGEAAARVNSWEIVDYASATKPDVPSGTARELAERLGMVREPELGRPLDEILGPAEARGATVAGTQVHSVRLPGFAVSTEIVFAASGERLVIRHDTGEDPAPYVAGTLVAIRAVGECVGVMRGLDRLLWPS